jgi:hypothetical protein
MILRLVGIERPVYNVRVVGVETGRLTCALEQFVTDFEAISGADNLSEESTKLSILGYCQNVMIILLSSEPTHHSSKKHKPLVGV